ncbi:hypothetical protein KIPB_007860, partial [Kipferlia bialata]
GPLRDLKAIASNVHGVAQKWGVDLVVGPDKSKGAAALVSERLVPIVLAWAKGESLVEVLKMDPSMFEGTFVRCLRRLAVLLDQMHKALLTIDATELAEAVEESKEAIFRGVVQLDSLYINRETEDDE